jgi:hypothetical protein
MKEKAERLSENYLQKRETGSKGHFATIGK